MASFVVLVSVFLSSAILSIIGPVVPNLDQSQMVCGDQKSSLACEYQEMKHRIVHLESILDERIQSSKAKLSQLEEKKKLIEEMTRKINFLQTSLSDMKDDSSYAGENLNKLGEDVQLLWAASRKNNFDIHILESKVQDAKERLAVLTSQVEKMTNIATELWIQIRHLEQALQITEIRILKAQRNPAFTTVTFLKVIKDSFESHLSKVIMVLDPQLFRKESTLSTYLSQALHQCKIIVSAAKAYHHKLQEFIKQKMERNEFTAALANQEVVFFLASAAVTFPTLMALKFLFTII